MNNGTLTFCGITDVGRLRTNNEDAFVAEWLDDSTVLAVAIDGMGGYEGGEVAAGIAQKAIPDYLKEYNRGERLELLKQAVVYANNKIYEQSRQDAERPAMACVLTAALVDQNRKVIEMVHVGDTRLYQFHTGLLTKLSHDHSLIGYREEVGDLTEEQAMHHPRRNYVNRDVGSELHEVGDRNFIEANCFPLLPNTTLLLCSDGLTDLITSHQITEILGHDLSLEEKAGELVDAANKAGGKDNVTVVLVDYRAEEADGPGSGEWRVESGVSGTENDACASPDSSECGTRSAELADVQEFPNSELRTPNSPKRTVIAGSAVILIIMALFLLSSLLSHRGASPCVCDTVQSQSWNCFLSEDSSYVLKLECLYADSLGSAYRAVIYDRYRFERGDWVCNPLTSPAYIGYGTVCLNTTAEFTFENGYTDSDGTRLRLTYTGFSDSVIIADAIPFSYNDGDTDVTFVRYSWDSLKIWWVNPYCR